MHVRVQGDAKLWKIQIALDLGDGTITPVDLSSATVADLFVRKRGDALNLTLFDPFNILPFVQVGSSGLIFVEVTAPQIAQLLSSDYDYSVKVDDGSGTGQPLFYPGNIDAAGGLTNFGLLRVLATLGP